MKDFSDVFVWKYEDLRIYGTNIIQHKIPLKHNTNPFKQKMSHVNPIFLPIIEKEVKNLLDAKIIVPLIFSYWVANLVPVRNKNGEIRICIDFRNLNKCPSNDNYPLSKMNHILQRVLGKKIICMIDDLFGYNQVSLHDDDKEKIAFKTPWGTFMYDNIPFGLMNAEATFERAMYITFVGEKEKSIVIYLDDIIVFS
jgi:hypothetical protein